MKYGYIKSSQNATHEIERQKAILESHGVDKIIIETSPKSSQNLQYLLKKIQSGDQICVTSANRITRNKEVFDKIHARIQYKGAELRICPPTN